MTIRTGAGPFETMSEPAGGHRSAWSASRSASASTRAGAWSGVTNPDGNIVTFWDLDEKRLVKQLDLPAPRGLTRTLDGESLVAELRRRAP